MHDLASRPAREELKHPHRPAQVEVKDLLGRQPVHLGKGLGRQQVVDRGAERSAGLGWIAGGSDRRPGSIPADR